MAVRRTEIETQPSHAKRVKQINVTVDAARHARLRLNPIRNVAALMARLPPPQWMPDPDDRVRNMEGQVQCKKSWLNGSPGFRGFAKSPDHTAHAFSVRARQYSGFMRVLPPGSKQRLSLP